MLDPEVLLSANALTPMVVLAGLSVAFGVGATHALTPGHGKTMVAAYLVGSQGTPLQAVLLGLVTTLTHTIGVFALGAIALVASQYLVPEDLYPVLSLLSGITVLSVGCQLLWRRSRSIVQGDHLHLHLHSHSHSHFHDHDRDHLHHHHNADRHHTHDAVTLRSLISLGIAGGLVPCPSALVLLLSAIALHQTLYGMALVGSFSVGLASVLIGLGMVAIYARHWLEALPSGRVLHAYLPIASAVTITIVGVVLSANAVMSGARGDW